MFKAYKEEYVNKTFRLSKKLAEERAQVAAASEISMNAMVAQCCRYALDHMGTEAPKEEN